NREGACGRGSTCPRRPGRSVPRASRAGTPPPASSLPCACPASARWLQRVEDLLEAVDVLSRPGDPVLRDLRIRAGAVDVADAVPVAEVEPAVADVELEAAERATPRPGRPGRAVAFLVVLPTMARAAETAGRKRRGQGHGAGLGVQLDQAAVEYRTVRLHRAAEVRTPVRDDREARLGAKEPVVADVCSTERDLAFDRVADVRRDNDLALLEVRERTEVDFVLMMVLEYRTDREAEDRHGDDAGDHAAETERRALEEGVARVGLARLRRGHGR